MLYHWSTLDLVSRILNDRYVQRIEQHTRKYRTPHAWLAIIKLKIRFQLGFPTPTIPAHTAQHHLQSTLKLQLCSAVPLTACSTIETSRDHVDLRRWARSFSSRFLSASASNPLLFVEALFWRPEKAQNATVATHYGAGAGEGETTSTTVLCTGAPLTIYDASCVAFTTTFVCLSLLTEPRGCCSFYSTQ